MKILIWILRIFILVVLVWFSVKNADMVTLHAYPWSWQAPLALIILTFFAAGLMLGLLASLSTLWGLNREVRSLKRLLKARENAEGNGPAVSFASAAEGPHGT